MAFSALSLQTLVINSIPWKQEIRFHICTIQTVKLFICKVAHKVVQNYIDFIYRLNFHIVAYLNTFASEGINCVVHSIAYINVECEKL
jgi:hypothetical protein